MSHYHKRMNIRAVIALLLVSLLLPACSRECSPQVKDGWIRMVPGGMPMHAGFGRIENPCPIPATIVSASSPAYGSVEAHESTNVDGISRMRQLPELLIDPQGAAVLEPGGMHLMLMQPKASLEEGSRIVIEFKLKDGRTVQGEFEVRNPAL